MSQQMVTEKREKTLAEQIMVVVLFALMMAGFIAYFFKQEAQITQTGFKALANSFSTKLIAVRSQWFMDKKPSTFVIQTNTASQEGDGEKLLVSVNGNGWIDVTEDTLACEKIWQLTMNLPLEFIQSPIAAVEVKKTASGPGRICRYSIHSGEYFEYHSASGKVIQKSIE